MRRGLGSWWPLAVAWSAALVALATVFARVTQLLGGRFVYGLDDAYIHLQVARNLAEHGSWGINPGAFESAVSSLLWPALLAVFHRVFGSAEMVPLVLNALLCLGLLALADRWLRSLDVGPAWRCFTLLFLAFGTTLVPVAFGGMEHVLQATLALLFLWLASSLPRHPTGARLLGLGTVAVLLALCRYEGLLLVIPVWLTFMLQRRWRAAVALAAAALPLAAFSLYSVTHGSYILPNSVLIKGAILLLGTLREHSWLVGVALAYPLLLALVAAAAVTVAVGIRSRAAAASWVRSPLNLATAWFVVAALLQWSGSRFTGQFHRYLLYLAAVGVVLLAAHSWRWWASGKVPRAAAIVLAALAVLASSKDFRAVALGTANASWDIAAQQGQMASFFGRYYPGQAVAVNDIGAISYLGGGRVVDLVGLATSEVTAMHLGRGRRVDVYARVAAERGARVAALYPDWFEGFVPAAWVPVGELRILVPTTVAGGDRVVFYAVDPGAADQLRANLQEFVPTAMPGTRLSILP